MSIYIEILAVTYTHKHTHGHTQIVLLYIVAFSVFARLVTRIQGSSHANSDRRQRERERTRD